MRARHPVIGGALLALGKEPMRERNSATGARGEEMVAATLEGGCRDEVVLLHDRARPRSRANIDHIAVAPTGVWVIDTKRYKGKKVRVRKPWLGEPRLVIGGRDQAKLVAGLAGQVALVAETVARTAPGTPVHGCFCFVDADLPLLGTPSIAGFPVLHRRALARRLNADGPLSRDAIAQIARELAHVFGPA